MNKKVDYKIFKKYKLIVELYEGTIGFDDIINNKQKSSLDENYDPDYAVLLDFRNAHIDLNPESITELFTWLRAHPLFQTYKKVAYLTSEPNEVVLTTLFKMKLKDIPIEASTFHTVQAALNWLNIYQLSPKQLEHLLNSFNI